MFLNNTSAIIFRYKDYEKSVQQKVSQTVVVTRFDSLFDSNSLLSIFKKIKNLALQGFLNVLIFLYFRAYVFASYLQIRRPKGKGRG